MGKQLAYKANRQGVAERFADPAVHKTIEVALALSTYYAQLLQDLELSILKTAQQHDATTLSLLPTVPGIGKILRLVLLSALPGSDRFPSVQECASSCRLVKCRQASGGKRWGTSGATIGNAHLQWAFAAAAVLFLRHNPQGQKLLTGVEKTHETGKALSLLAHTLARAGDSMLKRPTAFAMDLCLRT
jgi:transposase